MEANHLCNLTSEAPEADPRRLCSSLISSFLMRDLQCLSFQGGEGLAMNSGIPCLSLRGDMR